MKKKILSLLLAAALCLSLLTACSSKKVEADSNSSAEYEWTNEYGLTFDTSKLDYANFNIAGPYDENGYLTGITGSDYVTLPEDYKALSVKAEDIAVSEDELDEYVQNVMSGYGVTEQITDRAVADGDTVNINYVGSVDGVEFTGGSTQGYGTDVTAGSTDYIDDFLTQIIGHTPGETFDVVVTFPEGYADSTDANGNTLVLANKEAVFETTINYIAGETTVPECTDEWVAANLADYGFSTVQDVRDDLAAYYGDQNLYQYVIQYLSENSTYADPSALPREMLDYTACALLYTQQYYATSMQASLEDVLSMSGYDSVEAYLDANVEAILEDVHGSLLGQALMEAMDMKLSSEEAQTMLGSSYSSYVDAYGTNYVMMYANLSNCYTQLMDTSVVA